MLLTNSLEIIEKILGMCTDACKAQARVACTVIIDRILKTMHVFLFINTADYFHLGHRFILVWWRLLHTTISLHIRGKYHTLHF